MGGNSLFRHLVHFFGANLYFHNFTFGTIDSGMQGLVIIGFMGRDVVFETLHNRCKNFVNRAQHCVAFLNSVNNHTNRQQIKDLFKGFVADFHFSVDGIKMF